MHTNGLNRDIIILFISILCFVMLIFIVNLCTNRRQDESLRRSRYIPTPPLTPFSDDLENGMFHENSDIEM